jgi:hypothetical protein
MDEHLKESLKRVAQFYDRRKVGDVGYLGFRRSTDLMKLLGCLKRLLDEKIMNPHASLFLDLGCADGRVNVLMSYLVRFSVGIELDEWTLEEYLPLRATLGQVLEGEGLLSPPSNTFVLHGDATDEHVHLAIARKTGIRFEDFDLFYTYLVMHEEFARLISKKGKRGSLFMVYGLQNTLPKYEGFRLLEDLSPMEGILALYQKK